MSGLENNEQVISETLARSAGYQEEFGATVYVADLAGAIYASCAARKRIEGQGLAFDGAASTAELFRIADVVKRVRQQGE